jgi:hypothetical protein
MTHRALAPGSRSTSRPILGYSLDSALSRDPDPSYAATSAAHRKARPSIFPIKRDTTSGFVREVIPKSTFAWGAASARL